MAKVDWIYFDKIDAIMDDIPDHLWYNKHGQIAEDDYTVPEDVPSFPKVECLATW